MKKVLPFSAIIFFFIISGISGQEEKKENKQVLNLVSITAENVDGINLRKYSDFVVNVLFPAIAFAEIENYEKIYIYDVTITKEGNSAEWEYKKYLIPNNKKNILKQLEEDGQFTDPSLSAPVVSNKKDKTDWSKLSSFLNVQGSVNLLYILGHGTKTSEDPPKWYLSNYEDGSNTIINTDELISGSGDRFLTIIDSCNSLFDNKRYYTPNRGKYLYSTNNLPDDDQNSNSFSYSYVGALPWYLVFESAKYMDHDTLLLSDFLPQSDNDRNIEIDTDFSINFPVYFYLFFRNFAVQYLDSNHITLFYHENTYPIIRSLFAEIFFRSAFDLAPGRKYLFSLDNLRTIDVAIAEISNELRESAVNSFVEDKNQNIPFIAKDTQEKINIFLENYYPAATRLLNSRYNFAAMYRKAEFPKVQIYFNAFKYLFKKDVPFYESVLFLIIFLIFVVILLIVFILFISLVFGFFSIVLVKSRSSLLFFLRFSLAMAKLCAFKRFIIKHVFPANFFFRKKDGVKIAVNFKYFKDKCVPFLTKNYYQPCGTWPNVVSWSTMSLLIIRTEIVIFLTKSDPIFFYHEQKESNANIETVYDRILSEIEKIDAIDFENNVIKNYLVNSTTEIFENMYRTGLLDLSKSRHWFKKLVKIKEDAVKKPLLLSYYKGLLAKDLVDFPIFNIAFYKYEYNFSVYLDANNENPEFLSILDQYFDKQGDPLKSFCYSGVALLRFLEENANKSEYNLHCTNFNNFLRRFARRTSVLYNIMNSAPLFTDLISSLNALHALEVQYYLSGPIKDFKRASYTLFSQLILSLFYSVETGEKCISKYEAVIKNVYADYKFDEGAQYFQSLHTDPNSRSFTDSLKMMEESSYLTSEHHRLVVLKYIAGAYLNHEMYKEGAKIMVLLYNLYGDALKSGFFSHFYIHDFLKPELLSVIKGKEVDFPQDYPRGNFMQFLERMTEERAFIIERSKKLEIVMDNATLSLPFFVDTILKRLHDVNRQNIL